MLQDKDDKFDLMQTIIYFQNVIAFTVINIKEINNSTLKTLNWYNIMDGSEKIGKIYMAAEITQIMFNELTVTDNDLNVPLLKHVQPKLCVYQLVFSAKLDIYKIKLTYQHILLQTSCTILGFAPI